MRNWSLAALAMCASAAAFPSREYRQQESLIRQFPNGVVKGFESGNMREVHRRVGDTLTITLHSSATRGNEAGWAGACIENRVPVNLVNFGHVRTSLVLSASVRMDVKLERSEPRGDALFFLDHETVARGQNRRQWSLSSADAGYDIVAETKRMCFFVLSDDYPGGVVVLKLSRIEFDR